MAVYLVDRDLPGITLDGLVAMQRAAMAMCQDVTAHGTPVRYLHGLFVPGEARCLSLFEADDEAAVAAVNERAQLPFTRIVEAVDLPPEPTSSTGAGDAT
jgi:muconolactone delta-isomerase